MHQLMIGIQMLRLLSLAAVAMVLAVSPETADAQEYPWCVSRESYLYCFYQTLQQCQWTASGVGGCAPNPRLLFPSKPRDSNATSGAGSNPIEPDQRHVILDRSLRAGFAHDIPSRSRPQTGKPPQGLLARPAPLCKDQSPCIGGTPKQACQLECLVTFRTWGYQAGKLKPVR
jgi:hypothetical protein